MTLINWINNNLNNTNVINMERSGIQSAHRGRDLDFLVFLLHDWISLEIFINLDMLLLWFPSHRALNLKI